MSATMEQYMESPAGHRHVFLDGGLGILIFDESTGATVLERVVEHAEGPTECFGYVQTYDTKAIEDAFSVRDEAFEVARESYERKVEDAAAVRDEAFASATASLLAAIKDATRTIEAQPAAEESGGVQELRRMGIAG